MTDLVARLREAEAALARVKALAAKWEREAAAEGWCLELCGEAHVHAIRAALNPPPGCCPHCNHGPGFVHHVGCDAGCAG